MAENTEKKTAAQRASHLSDDILERLEARQLAAIQALRKLVDRLDHTLPDLVDDPALRRKVIDAIGDYYEQLVTKANEFLRSVVRGESRKVSKPGDAKDLYQFLRSFAPSGARETVNKQDAAKPAPSGAAKPASKDAAKPAKRAAQPAAKRGAKPAAN
ncbi:MAG: hypothetical protein ACLQIK_10110 [Mycobacterium sp.]|uniref:hypothetical protein n=1 Tax=Mycobacterium sp. TaxID=1785 RepID=UPI003F9DBE33